jgi:hypothetical protein
MTNLIKTERFSQLFTFSISFSAFSSFRNEFSEFFRFASSDKNASMCECDSIFVDARDSKSLVQGSTRVVDEAREFFMRKA